MMRPSPKGAYHTESLAGRAEVTLLRCKRCGKDLDTNRHSGKACGRCGSREWTNIIGWLSLRERIWIYRETKIWCMNPDWIDRIVMWFNREKQGAH
jgi:ribosomal protein S27AE|tara:strand:- start:1003 stop:1290 length:288 start_codon:yes stop_codon:yes gene_type:complete